MNRESLLAETFVELADTLVEDYDVVDLLTNLAARCVELFDVDGAGIMLAAPHGELRVIASSSAEMEFLEVFEVQAEEGPCPDCYRSGTDIVAVDLNDDLERWPTFVPEALGAGFRSAIALPLRLRGTTIGALNLFRHTPGSLGTDDLAVAQAFADIATIGILQRRAVEDARNVNGQLSAALESRVVIEQAKGMVAERTGRAMGASFELLRDHARRNNVRLADVAKDVIDGALAPLSLGRPLPDLHESES